MTSPRISIIIPTLNEASRIQSVLTRIRNVSNVEAIVVDGGSQDNTVALAELLGVNVLSSPPGRACQMNAGAKVATGDILLFLHADTYLPTGFDELIYQALSPPQTVVGAFELAIDSSLGGLRLIERLVNWRSRFFSLPYGDQAIFLKATVFRDVGGFAELPIMEDFEFIRRLQRMGKISIVPVPVLTSGRRWEKLGIFKTTLINQLIVIAYFLGVPAAKIAQWYRKVR